MAKLYPPQIEGTIKAFYKNENNLINLTVPFVMNVMVGKKQVSGFIIKIKSILNNKVLFSKRASSFNCDIGEAVFTIDDDRSEFLKTGDYYKVQIAYIDTDNVVGYYSTLGIVKYTTKPQISIEGLTLGQLHSMRHNYEGRYSQKDQDVTEKVYSYEFIIYDENNIVYETSGELLHNHEENENNYESIDRYSFKRTLQENKTYYLIYKVTTSNGLKISSPRYKIYYGESVEPNININLNTTYDYDNGTAMVTMESKKTDEMVLNGNFILSRTSSKDNYTNWDVIREYKFINKPIAQFIEYDFTLEHGYTYQYAIQQVNSNGSLISNRILSNTIVVEYEGCFLYDGEKQLKIAFNPKVSSFKETRLESQTNTIGSKFPYFFKNGNVNYKSFSISGLISYLSDNDQYFLSNEEMFLDDYSEFNREYTLQSNISTTDTDYFYNRENLLQGMELEVVYKKRDNENSEYNLIKRQQNRTTNLLHYNFLAERIFKLKVLEFLNNGKPKLFRSASEGNYIVQLTNSSLTPNDQLGRMLHTFTSTATETVDYNIDNLIKYNFIKKEGVEYIKNELKYETIKMHNVIEGENGWSNILNEHPIIDLNCYDMILGNEILINGEETIIIGKTGVYQMRFSEPVNTIQVKLPISPSAKITYGFWGEVEQYFDKYKNITILDVPCQQIINDTAYYLSLRNGTDIEGWNETRTEKTSILKLQRVFFTHLYPHEDGQPYPECKIIIKQNSKDPGVNIDISQQDEFYIKEASDIYDILIPPNIVANVTYQKKIIEYVEEQEIYTDEDSGIVG